MTKTEYLFNIKPTDLMELTWFECLELREREGRKLMFELTMKEDKTYEEEVRLHEVNKALGVNDGMIKEIEEV